MTEADADELADLMLMPLLQLDDRKASEAEVALRIQIWSFSEANCERHIIHKQ